MRRQWLRHALGINAGKIQWAFNIAAALRIQIWQRENLKRMNLPFVVMTIETTICFTARVCYYIVIAWRKLFSRNGCAGSKGNPTRISYRLLREGKFFPFSVYRNIIVLVDESLVHGQEESFFFAERIVAYSKYVAWIGIA